VTMRIGVIGAGRIGGNCARQAVKGGHEVKLSFARDPSRLAELASELGEDRASTGSAAEAVAFGDVVILSVPWAAIPEALAQAGDLRAKVVIDTTNQFGSGPMPAAGQTAASFNRKRMPGARYVKSFNTLTSRFQEEAASRHGSERVIQWICGDDQAAKDLVAGLIGDMGYVAVDLGATDTCGVMEPPRRPGAVYGEEYREADAQAVVDAVRMGSAIPPTPNYG
jgi:8-hydroxy-5-deazaflavin:NADPH oxidoreductase